MPDRIVLIATGRTYIGSSKFTDTSLIAKRTARVKKKQSAWFTRVVTEVIENAPTQIAAAPLRQPVT